MIDRDTVDRILAAARIEDIVGDFVSLRRKGASLWGLCPFHNEKTPSFCVTPSKNLCKCFGCGEGGGPVSFLMKLEKYTYEEALRYIAKKYGIEIIERELTKEELARKSARENMLALNSYAQKFFANNLYNTDDGQNIGMAYFRERGFKEDIIKKFQLGYSLNRYDALSSAALKDRHTRKTLIDTGLAIENSRGGLNDRFRDRVIFPVLSISGQVIAFSGRILVKNDNVGKYENSPESEVYHKGNELYGLYQAKSAIQKKGLCYLVEGNADVISMHQAGFDNTVASLGTALTVNQIKLIHRFTDNIVVLYDGDAAGIKAAIKAIDMIIEEGMNVEAALWPDGEDPDSFTRSHDSSEVQDYIDRNKKKGIFFKFSVLLKNTNNDPDKVTTAINTIITTISLNPDPISRSLYIKKIALENGVKEEDIIKKVDDAIKARNFKEQRDKEIDEKRRQQAESSNTQQETAQQKNPFTFKEERQLIRYILRYGNNPIEINSNGESVQITTLDYIAGSIEADNIPLQYPMHIQILNEALECEGDIKEYFVNHPDTKIQKYSFSLIEDKYEKSELYQRTEDEDTLMSRLSGEVQTIMFEYRFAIIKKNIEDIKLQIRQATTNNDNTTISALFAQLKDLDEKKRQITELLGRN